MELKDVITRIEGYLESAIDGKDRARHKDFDGEHGYFAVEMHYDGMVWAYERCLSLLKQVEG